MEGEKLKGKWKLIKFKDEPKNWLLIKAKDDEACSETDFSITESEPWSVLSGRTMDEIAKGHSTIKTTLPTIFNPQLATLIDKAPEGKEWLHEIKFDGYRLLSIIDEKITLMTRGQKDWTYQFPDLTKALKKLQLTGTILDGEVVVLDEKNRSNFQLLQNTLHEKHHPIIYYVFDIIYYKGKDLSKIELLERKKLLKKILPQTQNGIIRFSDYIIGSGKEVFEQACELGLEGIVSKNIHSLYVQKREKNWLKIKCTHRQEFVVGGLTKPTGTRGYFGSLLLGYYTPDHHFHYCGHVGTGFTERDLKEINTSLSQYKSKRSPFDKVPVERNLLYWVKPLMVVEVEFTEWTQDGYLRHPSFKGVRKDMVAPKNVKTQHSFALTHPDKILYATDSITKQHVAQFYENISEWILPYIVHRPLTIVRCPQGVMEPSFFQRHLQKADKSIEGLYSVSIATKSGIKEYIYIKDLTGLMALVQKDVLEIHTWGARMDKIENPDLITFDLDPGEGIAWKTIVKAALRIKEELEQLGLTAFVKTTGGKGLHVVIPILQQYTWDDVMLFSKTFAKYLMIKYPSEYIDTMSKSKRENKIFIDYFRNQRGSTAIAAYSTRAKEHAPIATPLSWEELGPNLKSDHYTIHNLEKRLSHLKVDPWDDFFTLQQKLPTLSG